MSTYDNSIVNAIYSSTLQSMHSWELPYQVKDELYQSYGQGQFFTDFLRRMGNEFYFTGNLPLNAHEEGWAEETFAVYGDSTGGASAGADVYVVVSPNDVDSGGRIRPRLYETVFHKHTDEKVYELYISAVTPSSTSVSGSMVDTYTLTLTPFDSTLTVGAGGIADGTELTIGGTAFAEYTGHPGSTARGFYRRQFYARIAKEKQTITGVELGTAHYYEQLRNGYKNIWSKVWAEKEFLLDKQIDYSFFLGQENTNSVVQADRDGNNRSVNSAKGIWKWMDELAGKLTYGTSDFDIFSLDDVSTYMRSQAVMSKNFLFPAGPGLYTKIENGGYDFIADYSSTDFVKYFASEGTEKSGMRSAALGLSFTTLVKDGNKFMLSPIDTFGNVKGLGNSAYDFVDAGMIIPMGNKSKVDGLGELSNISIGYNKHGNVDRKRVIKILNGPTGLEQGTTAHEYDGVDLLLLTHFMPFIMKANQCMQVLPYDSY